MRMLVHSSEIFLGVLLLFFFGGGFCCFLFNNYNCGYNSITYNIGLQQETQLAEDTID